MKCMSCGKEMHNTVGGNHWCDCGFGVNDAVLRPNNNTAWSSDWEGGFFNQGWVCPKCGAALSPTTSFCPFCAPKGDTITYATSTGEFIDINKYNKTISEELKDE